MSILKFDSYDDVIERANNTSYGLGAGVITKDCKKKRRILKVREIQYFYSSVTCFTIR